ncbi:MAG: SPFH domain-containing protein [Planctomycetota bacterium]
MAEKHNEDHKHPHPSASQEPVGPELDAAGKSLSEALRISFIILKVIMIVLIVAFLASGFETVGSDEQAIVLRFGKIRGVGEERFLGPGPHWILPYPIDEIIKIPVERKVNLAINSFWYFQTKEDMLAERPRPVRPDQPLNPIRDGYCITRSEKQTGATGDLSAGRGGAQAGSDGSDYNIAHTKWQLTYQIDDPERFFRNVYVADVKPGDIYFDVITGEKGAKPLLESMFEDAVVTTMVNYTIEEAISSSERIPREVKRLLQEKLDKTESGIKVVSVQLTKSEPPRQAQIAFEASIMASQAAQKAKTEARSYAENTLNEAAGPVANELSAALHGQNVSEETREMLWSRLAGKAQEKIAESRAYRARVVETAKANADYLERLLPEYRLRPKLVLQEIYLNAIEQIFENADEKFVLQTAGGTKGRELRVLLNRDPALKPKASREQSAEQGR